MLTLRNRSYVQSNLFRVREYREAGFIIDDCQITLDGVDVSNLAVQLMRYNWAGFQAAIEFRTNQFVGGFNDIQG